MLDLVSFPRVTAPLKQLTFPYYARLLDHHAADPGLFFAAAVDGDRTLGLVIARGEEHDHAVELLSLAVDKSVRRQGIGHRLLARAESFFAARGCRQFKTRFAERLPARSAFESLLAGAGFSPPTPVMHLYRFDLLGQFSPLFSSPRYEKYHDLANLPPQFQARGWRELSEEVRRALKAKINQPGWYAGWESPFQDEALIDAQYSLALWQANEVAGWVVSHRIRPDTLRFTHVFVRQELQPTGIIMALLVHLFVKSRLANGPRHCWLGIHHDNAAFQRLMRRRFGHYAEGIDLTFAAQKEITPGQESSS